LWDSGNWRRRVSERTASSARAASGDAGEDIGARREGGGVAEGAGGGRGDVDVGIGDQGEQERGGLRGIDAGEGLGGDDARLAGEAGQAGGESGGEARGRECGLCEHGAVGTADGGEPLFERGRLGSEEKRQSEEKAGDAHGNL